MAPPINYKDFRQQMGLTDMGSGMLNGGTPTRTTATNTAPKTNTQVAQPDLNTFKPTSFSQLSQQTSRYLPGTNLRQPLLPTNNVPIPKSPTDTGSYTTIGGLPGGRPQVSGGGTVDPLIQKTLQTPDWTQKWGNPGTGYIDLNGRSPVLPNDVKVTDNQLITPQLKPLDLEPVRSIQQSSLIPQTNTAGIPGVQVEPTQVTQTSQILPKDVLGPDNTQGTPGSTTDGNKVGGGYNTTQTGQNALDEYSKYALGTDPMVEAERQRLQRDNINRLAQRKREAHELAVRNGFQPGTPQYEQMMRNAITDAENQNVMATNNFHDFERQRRADKQRELMGLSDSEYNKLRETDQDKFNRFEQIAKYLPTDKGQQMALAQYLGGQDIGQIFRGMYNTDGSIKDEYKDLTRPELVKEGIRQAVGQNNINPDTKEAWKPGEQDAFIERFYADNFKNILYPSQTQSDIIEDKESSKGRLEEAIASNDYTKLTEGDFKYLTEDQMSQIQQKAINKDGKAIKGDTWEYQADLHNSEAMEKWVANNPGLTDENIGKVVKYGDQYYVLTEPGQFIGGKDDRKIEAKGINLRTGKEETILTSSEFDTEFW